jgi:hypothetical protein
MLEVLYDPFAELDYGHRRLTLNPLPFEHAYDIFVAGETQQSPVTLPAKRFHSARATLVLVILKSGVLRKTPSANRTGISLLRTLYILFCECAVIGFL